ncbi:gamma-glutamyl-gamma-aminobutyrate hydrolase family protein [Rhizobacter sp. J219]|jgi:putative glutamine amidotransferase|uniref:gamma-glutamyl-gamma-aminobutyrate hydrolase family protein n=1 Tax=Rhizobacter sp. J219 TaxID=2898430 RepID=UPI0021509AFA|nr:gamma-glutamyl-gamma-aminobutyrate hydrolase family protein [Rhizobacter sp. J219]MCR5882069.1 gamma-glutamyl-gamma-aminobutyrate hydrolase family protein [Rhizobacter sp. J219]
MNALPASAPARKPAVLVPACNRMVGQHPFHIAGKKYIDAIRLAGCLPLIVPFVQSDEIDELLDHADGVLLTGSPSNVHPSHFGEDVYDPTLPLDQDRDAWTLPMIPRALARGIPLFAICRGFQEANVALGGSLYQAVQEVPGQHDHRGISDKTPEEQYDFAHEVLVEAGGALEPIVGTREFKVNTAHGQGVKQLAPGLRVEARAPDGLIEAFSMANAPGFNLCVQWHPEWKAASNPISVRLFTAFGDACRAYRDRHRQPDPDR